MSFGIQNTSEGICRNNRFTYKSLIDAKVHVDSDRVILNICKQVCITLVS